MKKRKHGRTMWFGGYSASERLAMKELPPSACGKILACCFKIRPLAETRDLVGPAGNAV
jgi:hypothetical protein